MVLTRAFAPAEMGQYFMATAVCYFVLLVTTFGTHQFLVRSAATDADSGLALLGQVLVLRMVLTAIAFAALIAGTATALPDLVPIVLPVAVFVLVGDLGNSFGAYLTGKRAFALRFLSGVAGPIVLIATVPLAVAAGATLPQALFGFVAAGAAMIIAGTSVVWVRYGLPPLRLRRADLRRLVVLCYPFVAIEVLQVIHFKADVVMIYGLVSSSAAAQYETAYRLLEVSRIMARPLAVSALPICAHLISRGDWRAASLRARQAILWAALLGLAPAAIGLAAPQSVMTLVWGGAYAEAGTILRILLAGSPLVFSVLVGGALAIVLGRERALTAVMAAAAIVNIAMNALAIPVWGAIAAAWTTLATELFISACLVFLIWCSPLLASSPERRGPDRMGVTGW